MVFNLFCLTITIKKRKYTKKELERAIQRRYSRNEKKKMQTKAAKYSRFM